MARAGKHTSSQTVTSLRQARSVIPATQHAGPLQRHWRWHRTVPVNSANLTGTKPKPEAQQLGALGHVDKVVTFVRSVITGQP